MTANFWEGLTGKEKIWNHFNEQLSFSYEQIS